MKYILWTLLFTHISIMFVSVYLHRELTHKSLTLHPALAHVARFYLWITTGIRTTTWVAVHRKHHRYADQVLDPHSPQHHGFLKVLFGGTFLYFQEGMDAIAMQAYGRGCPRDWIERKVYEPWNYAGLPIGLGLYCLFFGPIGILMFLTNFLWIPFWAAGVVNGVGHKFGYRNFQTPEGSTNFLPLGLIMAGEELHNNHHATPGSAKLSKKWFEFDVGWLWIRMFQFLRLAHVHNS